MDASTGPARRPAPRGAGASARSDLRAGLTGLLTPAVAAAGFDLEDVEVARAGARSVVRVVVDRDGGLDLDGVADATRLVGGVLDGDEGGRLLPGAYVLEVTSPGVDRPLVAPRHWRRAAGRLVEVTLRDGGDLRARVREADDDGVTVVPEPAGRQGAARPGAGRSGAAAAGVPAQGVRLAWADVTRGVVQVEFARQGEDS